MLLITRVVLCFVLTVSVAVSCFAHLSAPQSGKIKSHYDSSKNETTVEVNPYLLMVESNPSHDPTAQITLTVSFTYSGQTLTASPTGVKLSIVSQARFNWEYEKAAVRSMEVKVDGEKVPLGTLDRVEARRVPLYSTLGNSTLFYYVEKLAILVPADMFQKIANGKKVIIRVGRDEHKLSTQNLKVLREVESMMRIK